ncbi:MAG TPA: hypothetical protein VMV44_12990, partial [Rectinemataceae bacterium]|nr:hypothetical protein [Rectinemataceae bacterium]
MMRVRLAILFVVASLALAACQAKTISAFPWTDLQGRSLAFSGSANLAEDRLLPGAGLVRFRLSRPYTVAKGSALAVDLDLVGIERIYLDIVGGDRKVLASFDFGSLDPSMRLVLPLPGIKKLVALDIRCSAVDGATNAQAILRALSFVPSIHGFSKEGGRTILSKDFSLLRAKGRLVATIFKPFEDLSATESSIPALRLAWKAGSASGSIGLVVPGRKPRHIAIRPGADSFLLPADWFDQEPASVEFDAPAGLDILECSSRAMARGDASVLDLGVVLGLPPTPGHPFDAYSWDAKPSVLVLDFADYTAQSASLKRLAFFV